MTAPRRMWVVGVCLLVAGSCMAQPGGRGGRGGRGGPGGMMGRNNLLMTVMEDIFLLNRFVSLQLTDAQLTSILNAYATIPDQPSDERIVKLREIRQRLVAGNPLVAADMQTIRDLFGRGRGGQAANAQPPTLSPLGQAIWMLLTDGQRAQLLASNRGRGGNNAQPLNRQQITQFLTQLNGAVRGVQDNAWPGNRDAMAEALATGADGQKDANRQKMFADFLDNLRGLPEGGFEQKQQELAASLEALAPTANSLALVWAQLDPAAQTRAMYSSFLHYKAPGLLKEMQAARQQANE